MTTWFISDMRVFDRHAKFYIEYKGRYSGKDYREYRVQVYRDGSWNVFASKGGWWKEVNGVTEELEPLLYGAIHKAQALLILKG